MKNFNYERDYKKFSPKECVEITFTDGKDIFKEKVRILSIDTQKVSFENNEITGECNSEEVMDIKKLKNQCVVLSEKTTPATSTFYKAVRVLNFAGYIFLSFIFYGLFLLVGLLPLCQTLIGILFSLFYFYFIIALPYFDIYKKKKESAAIIISNYLILLLLFHAPLYAAMHTKHEIALEVIVIPIFLLFFWPIHNLFMSIGRYLMQPSSPNREPSKKKGSFWKVLMFLLLSLPMSGYLFYLLSR